MKKTYFSCLYAAMCLGLAALAASCGQKEASVESLAAIGAADDVVLASGHAAQVLRNAACVYGPEGIELSAALDKIIAKGASPREKANIENALKIRGVDMDDCFYKQTAAGDKVLAFGLIDGDAFRQWLVEDMEVEAPASEDGYEVYALDSKSKLFANDANAYVLSVGEGECDLAALLALKEKASTNPMSDWQRTALAHGSVFVALVKGSECMEFVGNGFSDELGAEYYDIEAMKNGYAKVYAELQGMKLDFSVAFLDANGKTIKPKMAFDPINLDIFKYISKEDNIAFGICIPDNVDWKALVEAIDEYAGGQLSLGSSKMLKSKLIEVLGNVEGSVFVSAHPKNLMLAASGPQYWHATVGAQMKKGAAAGYINEIKSLASAYGIPTSSKAGSTVIELAPFTFYMKDVDGMFLLSTQPIEANNATLLSKDYFKGQMVALELTLAQGVELFNDDSLPFQPILALSSDGEKVSLDFELVGEGEYFLETLLSYIAESFN